MPKFAQFDPAASDPKPVTGWYDTDILTYPNLPPVSDLLQITQQQWESRGPDYSAWAVSGGALVDYTPPAPVLTPASQGQTALAAGVAVTFATSTALDGLYACDESTNNKVIAQIVSIQKNGTFTNGQTTRAWPATVDGKVALLTFDIPQFEALATAIGLYVDQLDQIILTNAGTLPAASLTVQA